MSSMANRVENEATHQRKEEPGAEEKTGRHVLDSLVIITWLLLYHRLTQLANIL